MARFRIPVVLATLLLLGACSDFESRSESSADGKTYLLVDAYPHDNCRVRLDAHDWTQSIHNQVEVTPGAHTLDCGVPGTEIRIDVAAATVLRIERWRS